MKKFLAKIAEVFQNVDGGTSARRVVGIACVTVAIIGFFTKRETELVLSFLGTGNALIGLTTFDPHPPEASQ